MQVDPDAFASMVVLTVKAALAPVLERLSASEQRERDLQTRIEELAGLRDRVTTIEAKAAVVTQPSAVPTPAELELSMRDRLDPLVKQVAGLSERVAVIEVKAPVPGPAGADGKDGLNGKDGADGLGFDDMDVEFDGDRTVLLKLNRGERTKTWPIVLPYQRYQGVFIEGKSYSAGDVVTWGGSQWHANEDTSSKPGEGSKAWTLAVKRGRDGKDGRDAVTVPVVRV